jgi:hypothetical protein
MGAGVSSVDRADILAVLEEQPYAFTDLAEGFGVSADAMRAMLKVMKRDGLLKQVGTAQQWALASFVADTGRRPTLDRDAIRTAILAAVAGGPTPTHAIVDASGFSRTTVKGELEALLGSGQLQHLGVGRGAAWALASWVAPVPEPDDVDEAIASDAEDLDDLDAAAAADDEEDLPLVHQRERGQRRLYPAGTRQAATSRTTTKPGDDPAWWVGLDRDQFAVVAAKRAEAMRDAKENRHVPLRILQ